MGERSQIAQSIEKFQVLETIYIEIKRSFVLRL